MLGRFGPPQERPIRPPAQRIQPPALKPNSNDAAASRASGAPAKAASAQTQPSAQVQVQSQPSQAQAHAAQTPATQVAIQTQSQAQTQAQGQKRDQQAAGNTPKKQKTNDQDRSKMSLRQIMKLKSDEAGKPMKPDSVSILCFIVTSSVSIRRVLIFPGSSQTKYRVHFATSSRHSRHATNVCSQALTRMRALTRIVVHARANRCARPFVPRVQVKDGKLVVDEASLYLTNPSTNNAHNEYNVVYESTNHVTSSSYANRTPSEKWSKEQTERFYEVAYPRMHISCCLLTRWLVLYSLIVRNLNELRNADSAGSWNRLHADGANLQDTFAATVEEQIQARGER
jgi:hypothetical protein